MLALLLVASSTQGAPSPPPPSLIVAFQDFAKKFEKDAMSDTEFGQFVRRKIAAEDYFRQKLHQVPNMTCAQCYKIHGGVAGDCSSVFGCNSKLCNFCTNDPTCTDCYQIHGGAKGDCCVVAGCDHTLRDFCTNPDSTPTSCPPTPPPSPPTPSGCPGGSLKACIALCPTDPCVGYQACSQNCVSKC